MAQVIPYAYQWHFRKSDGYMDLGMWDRAREELDQVPSAFRQSVPYRQLALRLEVQNNHWMSAANMAESLCKTQPDEAGHWIQFAYVTRRLKGVEAARQILQEAHRRFPREAIIPFNLACYECALGHREEALRYLGQAEALAPQCRILALEDDDLKPLWSDLEN